MRQENDSIIVDGIIEQISFVFFFWVFIFFLSLQLDIGVHLAVFRNVHFEFEVQELLGLFVVIARLLSQLDLVLFPSALLLFLA